MNEDHAQADQQEADELLRDRFDTDIKPGRVIGRSSAVGLRRGGIDVEKTISSDNGALRIEPLLEPGWERSCLSYGPFEREPGLVLSVYMLNGHNTSQAEALYETFRYRLACWILGSRVFGGRVERLRRMLRAGGRIGRTLRRFMIWRRLTSREVPKLDENLSVGWFPAEVSDPNVTGSAFVMHATGPNCGELWIRERDGFAPVVGSVQNLPLYYVVVLRESDAIYYVSSVPRANTIEPYPALRPVGISPTVESDKVWASVHQSTLGQIGFRLDTRVYGVSVARDPARAGRFAGAHFADDLVGEGSIQDRQPGIGSGWQPDGGAILLSASGASSDSGGRVSATPPQPSGLMRCRVAFRDAGDTAASVQLRFRGDAAGACWCLEISPRRARLSIVGPDGATEVASSELALPAEFDLQLLDAGKSIRASANGVELFEPVDGDERLADNRGIGFDLPENAPNAVSLRDFEAHPRSVELPGYVDHGKPWSRLGTETVVRDDFSGQPGDPDGSLTTVGDRTWRKLVGKGRFERDGEGALRVVASREEPCAGRTMYGIDWDDGDFVDIEVLITPPGTARGERENGLSGVVIWQDEDNYITINSWVSDGYDGASISCFFNARGWEDLYDAIWSNVGARIRHGVPYRMRVTADSEQYMVRIDGEPVLYRAYRDVYPDWEPLRIKSVGLITNWEWALDTGSVFRDFHVRR